MQLRIPQSQLIPESIVQAVVLVPMLAPHFQRVCTIGLENSMLCLSEWQVEKEGHLRNMTETHA